MSMTVPIMHSIYCRNKPHRVYGVIVSAVAVCGLADGLIGGSCRGATSTVHAGGFCWNGFFSHICTKCTGKATWACATRIFCYPFVTACLSGPNWLRIEFPVVSLTSTLGLTNGYLTSAPMILAPKSVPVEGRGNCWISDGFAPGNRASGRFSS
ncbi:hypothetical protein L1049_004104 [Liquidambar formosana]|uniref:Uncharacterized protein n=1 Tax=Liquidambar formosana TaxID=63359 RepID=A0AAP0RS73_LIQFO